MDKLGHKTAKSTTPKLAQWLLNKILPNAIKDEISGDLEEEFNHYVVAEKGETAAYFWFWQQTFSTCGRYIMNTQRTKSLAIVLFSLGIFSLILMAVAYLSFVDTPNAYAGEYWYNGQIHKLFFDPLFWQLAPNAALERNIDVGYLIDINSFVWAIFSLATLYILDKKYHLSISKFSALAITLTLTPYFWGVSQFVLYEISLRQTGPLIATMWLTIFYMILPISYHVVKKLNNHNNDFVSLD